MKIQHFFSKLIDTIFFFFLLLSLRLRRYRKSKPSPVIATMFNVLTQDKWLTTQRIKELVESKGGPNETIYYYDGLLSGLQIRGFVERNETDTPCSRAEAQWKLTAEGAAERRR